MTDAEKLETILVWLADRRMGCGSSVIERDLFFQEVPEAREWEEAGDYFAQGWRREND